MHLHAFQLAKDPQLRLLIDKLSNAAIGGLTGGFLGQDRAMQVEAAMAAQVEAVKDVRRRAKLTTDRAVTGEELLRLRKELEAIQKRQDPSVQASGRSLSQNKRTPKKKATPTPTPSPSSSDS